ncbi:LamG domain-containing protein [Opitutales bacterium]|nr:LamG domain-containing protein [Opitutales bacterium]
MKKLSCLSLLALTAGVCAHAATLTNRYDFNGDAADSVGTLNGNLSAAGTNLEAPLFQSDIPDDADDSFASNSIEFGMNVATASFVNFGSGVQTDIYDGKAGSVAYWFKADTLSGDMFSNVGPHRTILKSNGDIRLGGGTVDENFSFTGDVTAGTWHHFSLTWNDVAGAGTIALDGDIQTYSFTPGALTDPSRLMVGNFSNNASNVATQFDGHIYDLQIYDGVLTNGEISTLAGNAGTAIPEPGTYALLGGIFALTSVMVRRRRS